jgi:hypothetical protein
MRISIGMNRSSALDVSLGGIQQLGYLLAQNWEVLFPKWIISDQLGTFLCVLWLVLIKFAASLCDQHD